MDLSNFPFHVKIHVGKDKVKYVSRKNSVLNTAKTKGVRGSIPEAGTFVPVSGIHVTIK